MTLSDPPSGGALSDSELDAMLARADEELLEHVRAHTHPDKALLAMMAVNDGDVVPPITTEVTVSAAAVVRVPSDHAVTVIAMRMRTRDIDQGFCQLLRQAEDLREIAVAAARLNAALKDASAIDSPARSKRHRSGRRRLRWLALLIVLLDGALGYASAANIGGSAPVALLGAVFSVIILVVLELTLAVNWTRWGRLGVSLVGGLGVYVASALAFRRLAVSAGPGPLTAAATAAFGGCAALLVLASSCVLRRQGARESWGGEDHSRPVSIHDIGAAFGIGLGSRRFVRLAYLVRTQIFQLAASADLIDAHQEFHTEISEIRSWAFQLADNAECSAGGNSEIRELGSALASAVDELSRSLAALDRELALVRSLIDDVMPHYLAKSGQWQIKADSRKRREIAANIAHLATQGVRAGEKLEDAAADLSDAKRLNPIRELAAVEVDASGADLSTADVRDLELFEGVIWTDDTTWPPGTRERIRAHSDVIKSGVYQVRHGNERDPILASA